MFVIYNVIGKKIKKITGSTIANSGVEDKSRWLKQLPTYTRKDNPANIDEIATREIIECSNHLKQQLMKCVKKTTLNSVY